MSSNMSAGSDILRAKHAQTLCANPHFSSWQQWTFLRCEPLYRKRMRYSSHLSLSIKTDLRREYGVVLMPSSSINNSMILKRIK